MTDNLRDRIAAVLDEHYYDDASTYCGCGRECYTEASTSLTDYPQHVADAVIRELGLKVEDSKTYTGGNRRFYTIEGNFNEPI